MKLVFATHNLHKLEEIKLIIPGQIELISLGQSGCDEDIPETGDTLDENASAK